MSVNQRLIRAPSFLVRFLHRALLMFVNVVVSSNTRWDALVFLFPSLAELSLVVSAGLVSSFGGC